MLDDREMDDMLRASMKDDMPDVSGVLARVREGMRPGAAPRPPRATYALGAVAALFLIMIVGGAFMIQARRKSALAVDAACDHFDELVQASDKNWITAPADVDAYLQQHFPRSPHIVRALTPAGGSFEKLASCRLLTARFTHFVYRSEGREVSVFVRLSGPDDNPVRRTDYVDSRLHLQVAGFVTQRYQGLVVAALSPAATRAIADTVAARL
jgi:hypothetical protein